MSSDQPYAQGSEVELLGGDPMADVDLTACEDFLDEIVMALDVRDRDTLGCCYYSAAEEKLYVMQDIRSGGQELVDKCKMLLRVQRLLR